MDIKSSSGIERAVDARRITADSSSNGPKGRVEGPESADQLTLTAAGKRLVEASQESSEGAPVDRARVEALRQSIADGSYTIDSGRIATSLIRTEADLID